MGIHFESGAQSGALSGKTAPKQAERIDQGDTLAKLTAALLTLSPADRAKLAAMLTGQQDKSEGDAT